MRLLPPPGPQRRRQLIQLSVLGVIALGSLWWALRGSGAAVPATAPAAQVRAKEIAMVIPEPVKIAALDPVAEEPTPGRNLFRYGVKPPPPRPPEPPRAPQPPVQELPPPPPPPPQVQLDLTGLVVGPDQQRTAVLKDPKTGAVFYGVDGAVIDGQYRVVKVAEMSAIVEWLDGTGRKTIPIKR
jgi:hypothetical protein